MYEAISEAASSQSRGITAIFVLSSLGLLVLGMAFAHGVFTGMAQIYLGLLLSAGFALIAVMLLTSLRLGYTHRITIETDEELW